MFREFPLYTELPPPEGGYELDPYKGFFGVVIPSGADVTNLITNPSFETGTTNYAASSGTLAQDSAISRRGLYSGRLTPTANSCLLEYNNSFATAVGTTYYFSVDVLGQAGVSYRIAFIDSGDTQFLSFLDFTATGLWQRVTVAFNETQAGVSRRVRVAQNGSPNRLPVWTDGWMVQTSSPSTLYIDGDQVGFVSNRQDYYWTGVPHASASICSGQCRAGGRVVPLSDFGFHLNGIMGLGHGGVTNQLLPIATGGASYQGTVIGDRQFALTGVLYANGLPDLQRRRQALINAFKDDLVSPDQPLKLIYQQFDDSGNALTTDYEIVCVPDGDPLVGKTDNRNAESLALTFRILTPITMQESGEVSVALANSVASVGNANFIAFAPKNAQWNNIGTGLPGQLVYAGASGVIIGTTLVLFNPYDGRFYVGSSAVSMNGVANTAGIFAYDPVSQTVQALGTGCSLVAAAGAVFCLTLAPNGDVWVGGTQINNFGGVANTQNIARWSLSAGAWQSVATGGVGLLAEYVGDIAVFADGTAIVTGGFATASGVAAASIARRSAAGVWTALGTGLTGGTSAGYALEIGLDQNTVYIGGSFTAFNGIPVTNLAIYTKSTSGIAAMGTGANLPVSALLMSPSGILYLTGSFTTLNGISCNYIGSYNGTQFSPLSSGLLSGSPQGLCLAYEPFTGFLHVGGIITSAGGVPVPNGYVIWNGSAFIPPDVVFPGGISNNLIAIATDNRGNRLAVFSKNAAVLTSASFQTATHPGSAAVPPKFVITGPGTLYVIRNLTTKKALYFNLTMLAGETVTLNLSNPVGISLTSSFRRSLLNTLLGGSDTSSFMLAPGANIIEVLYNGTTGASVVGMYWRNAHHSIDGAIPVSLGL